MCKGYMCKSLIWQTIGKTYNTSSPLTPNPRFTLNILRTRVVRRSLHNPTEDEYFSWKATAIHQPDNHSWQRSRATIYQFHSMHWDSGDLMQTDALKQWLGSAGIIVPGVKRWCLCGTNRETRSRTIICLRSPLGSGTVEELLKYSCKTFCRKWDSKLVSWLTTKLFTKKALINKHQWLICGLGGS